MNRYERELKERTVGNRVRDGYRKQEADVVLGILDYSKTVCCCVLSDD